MKTSQILLIAIALLVLSSDHMPAKVSAAGCQSYVLNPVAPCDPAKCRKDCDAKIKGGVGTCYGHPFHKGCDCEYCPAAASSSLSSSALPRKVFRKQYLA